MGVGGHVVFELGGKGVAVGQYAPEGTLSTRDCVCKAGFVGRSGVTARRCDLFGVHGRQHRGNLCSAHWTVFARGCSAEELVFLSRDTEVHSSDVSCEWVGVCVSVQLLGTS